MRLLADILEGVAIFLMVVSRISLLLMIIILAAPIHFDPR